MFGYVVPNQAALSDEAQKRYRTAYCGLCRRIDALHLSLIHILQLRMMMFTASRFSSRNTQRAAPRLSASMPSWPLPAYRSSTVSYTHLCMA